MGRVFYSYPIIKPAPATPQAETAAWVAQVVANGGTVSSGRQTTVNELIYALKNYGLWDKTDRLWLHAAEDEPSALTDLKGLTLAVNINSAPFTVDRGYTGNGADVYIDSVYNPVTDAVTLSLDSTHIGSWVRTVDTAGVKVTFGNTNASTTESTVGHNNGNAIWIGNGAGLISISGFGAGHILGVRTASNVNALYGNGANKTNDTSASVALMSTDMSILAEAVIADGVRFTGTSEVSISHLGGGLTDTEVTNYYNVLSVYMAAVGA